MTVSIKAIVQKHRALDEAGGTHYDSNGRPTKHTIEAQGIKGMKSTPWRKTFKHAEHLNKWAEDNDAEVHGTRDLEQASHGNLSPAIREETLDEVHRPGHQVIITGGPSDVRGKIGRIGEVQSHLGGKKTYIVDYSNKHPHFAADSGYLHSIALEKHQFKGHSSMAEETLDEAKELGDVAKVKRALEQHGSHSDTVGKNKDGHVVVRRGFFYSNGGSAEKHGASVSAALTKAGVPHTIIHSGEHQTSFRGGASTARSTHWYTHVKVG